MVEELVDVVSADPPENSIKDVVDLMGKGEFFLYSLVGGESKGRERRFL
jgi:hypothetical protein